ncbi:MarR family winged helix-turn-helix transcriptional regulator [Polaribacter sargassicola]|uniref:MarR family winged helix-turn-helix transcriptional regulator n=1 Tax=Polaribacter sargassicola TaxID=2836891 RepID=UPI001F1FCF31|nr:MarR family winged helix-turn-helix transcriptional regulator [Polaribacter sp. DS7-9]MCG1034835.1 MarR family winged helix-turn-helix transcriptional regulator [Polaribacter sp. DS7-9]
MENNIIQKIREFNRFYTGIIGVTNNHILESSYSLTEVRVMYEIYSNPEITARLIKNLVNVDEGYLSRLIKKLVRQNIIEKEKSKKDNRISILKLSKKGEIIFLKLNKNSSKSVKKLISHLTSEEQKKLIKNLQEIHKLLIPKNKNEH